MYLHVNSNSHVGTCQVGRQSHQTTGHARGAYGSVRERLSKARTAFPVGPLARVGGWCTELDVSALKTGGRLSVLVILSHTSRHGRVARTGRACVTSVQKLLCTAIRERLGATWKTR